MTAQPPMTNAPTPAGMAENLPCPFCKNSVANVASTGKRTFFVECYGGCRGPKETSYALAMAAWNRRVAQPSAGAVLDALSVTLQWVKIETKALEHWRADFGDYLADVTLGHDNVWSYRVNNSGRLHFNDAEAAKDAALIDLRERLSARLFSARKAVALYDAALTKEAPAATGAGEWEAHVGNDYAVVMLPNENTDTASIQVFSDDKGLPQQIADALNSLRAQPQACEEAQTDSGGVVEGLREDDLSAFRAIDMELSSMGHSCGNSMRALTEARRNIERLAALAPVAAEGGERDKLREVLAWYGEQARLARLIHSEGDIGRAALADDGGKRAQAALRTEPTGGGEG